MKPITPEQVKTWAAKNGHVYHESLYDPDGSGEYEHVVTDTTGHWLVWWDDQSGWAMMTQDMLGNDVVKQLHTLS